MKIFNEKLEVLYGWCIMPHRVTFVTMNIFLIAVPFGGRESPYQRQYSLNFITLMWPTDRASLLLQELCVRGIWFSGEISRRNTGQKTAYCMEDTEYMRLQFD